MRHLLTCLAICIITACDEPETDCAVDSQLAVAAPLDAPDVSFREQGKPWLEVIEKPKTIGDFISLALSCPIPQPLTISLSGYLPNVTITDQRVVGFHFSMMADQATEQCMHDVMAKAGAVKWQ